MQYEAMRKLRLLFVAVLMVVVFKAQSISVSVRAKQPQWKWHSARYQKTDNFRSLKVLVKRLRPGMPRSKVESILGEPDYSPVDGQYYYSSDKKNAKGVIIGLVIEYRKYVGNETDMTVTGKLESFSLMPIGE
jgi:hypothetical protein